MELRLRGYEQLALWRERDALAVEVRPRERLAVHVAQGRRFEDSGLAEPRVACREAQRVEASWRGALVIYQAVVNVSGDIVGKSGDSADVRAVEGRLVEPVGETEEVHAGGAGRGIRSGRVRGRVLKARRDYRQNGRDRRDRKH
jgi:hypothetical protein